MSIVHVLRYIFLPCKSPDSFLCQDVSQKFLEDMSDLFVFQPVHRCDLSSEAI